MLKRKDEYFQATLTSVLSLPACRSVQRSIDFQTLSWLTVLSFVHHHFDLSSQQFHDALSLHYHRPMMMLPHSCDGCGAILVFLMHLIVIEVVWLHSDIMK